MPHRKNNPTEQFMAVEELILRWLKARRNLLGKYTEIAVTQSNLPGNVDLGRRQRELCQLLVDYVSAGHFEVFQELISEAEFLAGESGKELAEKLMPAIADTTEVIMAYEEKYGAGQHSDKLKRDLSALGETLESRFMLEDRMIAGLHQRYRQQAGGQLPTSD